jgi:hypothetical protein
MSVIAKLKCTRKDDENGNLRLEALYDEDSPENKEFFEATPFAVLEMAVMNPSAFEFFEEEESYLLRFERAGSA